MDNTFFKPTPLYKEFMILNLIEKNSSITQREISDLIGVAVSMVNYYINIYESNGLIKRRYRSSKTVEYYITITGIERKKVLNISYLNDSLKVFKSASQDIVDFLYKIISKGFKKILLYGAGEVAEILLQTIFTDNEIPIEILGVIDDDIDKHNAEVVNVPILDISAVEAIEHDGVLISSYTNRVLITKRLSEINYDKKCVIDFFDTY